LVWNYAVALLIARFNTEDNQARIIRNFQAGVQGNESLATYFDTMLESAKGASSSMSFQQQANTIRSGMRDGTLVKAQLMGKAIPKLFDYEALVTLVKHTWLPEAVNYNEAGPARDRMKDRPKPAPSKQYVNTPKPSVTQQRCSSSKCVSVTHSPEECWMLHPELFPEEYKKPREERNKASASNASTKETPVVDAKGAADSSKKNDSASKGNGSNGGKGSGSNAQKPGSS